MINCSSTHYTNASDVPGTHLVERLVMALLADGHLLVEGAPGLAKTRAIKCLADGIEGSFHRIQFTPDLLPGDITGGPVLEEGEDGTRTFVFHPGPIFGNTILADEISPDSCRLWDLVTNEKLDKDRFRRDMGGESEAYQEVARRLGLLQNDDNGPGEVLDMNAHRGRLRTPTKPKK